MTMVKIFEDFKKMFNNDTISFNSLDHKNLFIYNMWAGNEISNVGLFCDIEEAIAAGVDNKILFKELYLRINKNIKHITFPKKAKEESDWDWLKDYYMKFYHYSKREVNMYWKLIMTENKEEISKKFGLDNIERKKLGLNKVETIKIEKIKQVKLW